MGNAIRGALAVVIALCLTTAVFASGGSESTAASAGPMKITIKPNYNSASPAPDKDAEIVKIMNQRFNVDIQLILTGSSFNQEQENLLFASGEIPDQWIGWRYFDWDKQGIVRPITKAFATKYMPTAVAIWDQNMPAVWGQRTFEGKLWGFPVGGRSGASGFIRVLRKDWLTKLGLKEPTTLNELENVFRAFTFKDPDGNGKDDTVGNAPTDESLRWAVHWGDVFGAFGSMPGYWVIKGDSIVAGSADVGFKEGLKTVKRWYQEGIVNKEMFTDSWDRFLAKFSEGKIGSYFCNWYWISPANTQSPCGLLKQKNAAADFTVIGPVKGPNGDYGTWSYSADLGWSYVWGKDVKDDKLAKCMDILEALQKDQAFFTRIFYGVKDTDYKVEASGKFLATISNEEIAKKGLKGLISIPFVNDYYMDTYLGKDTVDRQVFELGAKARDLPVFRPSADTLSDDARAKSADIAKISDEFAANAVTGKIDIDAEWDGYVKKLMDAGLKQQLDEINKYYKAHK